MTFVSITRLRIRASRHMPGFVWLAVASRSQLRRAPGFRRGALLADRRLTFWTMTVWDCEESMRAYRASGAHRSAMPLLTAWCDEASIVHWTQAEDGLPSWSAADRRMRAESHPSRVRAPSPDHLGLTYRTPRVTGAAPVEPWPRGRREPNAG